MPVTPGDLVVYLCLLSEEMDLRVTVSRHMRGGLITGTSAAVGGICGGPLGVLLGGVFGTTVAAVSCKDKYEFVKDIMINLNFSKRMEIFDAFQTLLRDEFLAKNFTEFSARIEKNLDLKHEVLKTLKTFLVQKWKLKLFDPRLAENKE